MVEKLGDYIVSPLAMGSHANYRLVKDGQSSLRRYDGARLGVGEPFVASLVDDDTLDGECLTEGIAKDDYTRFERMAILAASRAVAEAGIDAGSQRTVFVLATTKGNVASLASDSDRALLTAAAARISGYFGNAETPLVVSNACISGLSAQLCALRLLESRRYDTAVVIGADEATQFTVSGFQSLKAASTQLCRPFDDERIGLNFGEAAACIVYGYSETSEGRWRIVDGAMRNDAFHLSSPSRQAEGAYEALRWVADRNDMADVAFVNVHGTATLFNDEMEATALSRMGWDKMPIFGLKGYYGHTMGAAGVLETILSMEAADDHTVLATKGFHELGVSRSVGISSENRHASGSSFIKMMSGFGGGNAVAMFSRGVKPRTAEENAAVEVAHRVDLSSDGTVVVDGMAQTFGCRGMELLKAIYQKTVGSYPKFHKMDLMSKVGFIASELLLQREEACGGEPRFTRRSDRMVALTGKSASIAADRAYLRTIDDSDNYYPSPSAFVYTLPNIVTGEIAIRNRYHGETMFLGVPRDCAVQLADTLMDEAATSAVTGWVEAENEENYKATLYLVRRLDKNKQ